MKATRHNGRSGKHGSYNPKHNDRQFDISHSEHIDGELALQKYLLHIITSERKERRIHKMSKIKNYINTLLDFYEPYFMHMYRA